MRLFRDRAEAGLRLGAHLAARLEERGSAVVVLGIPRGGVIVAAPVADALQASLDVVVPRKLGAPDNPELAVAAVALADGEQIVVRDEEALRALDVSEDYLDRTAAQERHEIVRRLAAYRQGGKAVPLAGRTVVVVDDGLATGLTARAAVEALSRLGPRRLVLAVPVAPPETIAALGALGIHVEALEFPSPFRAVGRFYDSFEPVDDAEVLAALRAAEGRPGTA